MKKAKNLALLILHFVLVCAIALSIAFILPACNIKDLDDTPKPSDTTDGDKDNTGSNDGDKDNTGSNDGDKDNTGSKDEQYAYETPSGVKVSVDNANLKAGDTFTVTLEIASNLSDYNWHSVNLVLAALDGDDKADLSINSNFEYVSHKTSFDDAYFRDTSSAKFNATTARDCGMCISISNKMNNLEKTLATDKLVIEVTLKVKDNAQPVQSFNFGVAPIKANYVAFCKGAEVITYQANNKTLIGFDEDSEAGDCITINKIAMSVSAKAN